MSHAGVLRSVMSRSVRQASEAARSRTQGKRTIQAMTWGLVPSWTKDSETKLDFFRCDLEAPSLLSERGNQEVLIVTDLHVFQAVMLVLCRMFNARSETVPEKSVFNRLLSSKRCVVLLNGFYEWAQVVHLGSCSLTNFPMG